MGSKITHGDYPLCYVRSISAGKIVNAKDRKVEMTCMEWEVYPNLFIISQKIQAYENIPPLIITENGAAFQDTLQNNVVHDPERLQYIQNILQQVLRAKQEGVNVNGYFVWTFL